MCCMRLWNFKSAPSNRREMKKMEDGNKITGSVYVSGKPNNIYQIMDGIKSIAMGSITVNRNIKVIFMVDLSAPFSSRLRPLQYRIR